MLFPHDIFTPTTTVPWGTHPAVQQLPSGHTSQDQPRSEHRREKKPNHLLAPGHSEIISRVLAPKPPSKVKRSA